MQAVSTYLIFILVFMALVLSIVAAGVLFIALYEAGSWIWSLLHSRPLGPKTALVHR